MSATIPLTSVPMANSTQNTLRVTPHNVLGINSPLKHKKVFDSYRSMNLGVVMFQETHSPIRYSPTFLHAHFPRFYLANAGKKPKGVAIAFSKTCMFNWISDTKDPEGRFLLVNGTIEGQIYSLVSYYTPKKGHAAFFSCLFDTLNPMLEDSHPGG